MAGKVTLAQIDKAKFTTDDFRENVNYVNPKNKGYVRFEPDGKGGVKLAKINNKVDAFLGLRTNIDSGKNQAMREKFADALTRELKWADEADVEKLAASIKKVTKGRYQGQTRTDALSRKELKAAFKTYDKLINSSAGRGKIVENLLKDAAKCCGLPDTAEALAKFKDRIFPTADDLAALLEMQEENEDIPVGKPGHMKMDEATFKAKMLSLELKCNEEVQRAKAEKVVRDQAKTAIDAAKAGNGFGMQLSEDDKVELRGALFRYLSAKGLVQQAEDGKTIGTCGSIFETFINEVLPELFKKGVQDVVDGGENADEDLQMEANFSFESIVDEAEKFMNGARDYMSNPPDELKGKLTGNKKIDEIIADNKLAVDRSRNAAKESAINTAVIKIANESNIDGAEAKRIKNDMVEGMAAFDKDGLLKTFAQKFLAERGIGENVDPANEQSEILGKTLDSIIETARNVGIAVKLEHGSAKTGEDGKKVAVDSGMGGYVKDMEDAIEEIASGADGRRDMALMGKLMTFTLANIANRKVEEAAAGTKATLQLDKEAQKTDKELLQATADAYTAFEAGARKTIDGAKAAFGKLAKTLVKKGQISQRDCDDLIRSAAKKFKLAHKAALQDFFAKSPVEDAETGKKLLSRLLKSHLEEAKAELFNDLAIATFDRTVGAAQRRELSDVSQRVNDALAQPGLDKVKLGRPGIIDEETARKALADGELKRLWTATLASHLKDLKRENGVRRATPDFVAKVVADFNKKAKELVESVAKKTDALFAEAGRILEEQIGNIIDNGAGEFADYAKGPKPMTKEEKTALVKDLAAETLQFKTAGLRSSTKDILSAPASFNDNDVKTLAKTTVDDFRTGGANSTMNGLAKIVNERKTAVEDFVKQNLTKDVAARISKKGVFGKGGALENAGDFEKDFFIRKAVAAVKTRMRALPLVYATNDKEALLERVANEALKEMEAPVKEWATFRRQFMAGVGGIEAEHSALTGEKIDALRDWVLAEILGGEEGTSRDPKTALEYYRNTLANEVDSAIKKTRTKFGEYVAKIDKTLAPAKALVQKAIDDNLEGFKDRLTEEAFKHLTEVIVPKMMRDIEYAIYRAPDAYMTEESRKALAERVENDFGTTLCYGIFDGLSTKDDAGLKKLIKICGAGVILKDANETKVAIDNLRLYLSSPETQKMLADAEIAILDHFAEFGTASFEFSHPEYFAPTEPGNATAKFRFEFAGVLRNLTAQMLYLPFDNDHVGEAKEKFERWVDSHGLSRYEDFSKTSAKDVINAKFAERVKSLQDAALRGDEPEPILTPSFIKAVDQIIDSTGVERMIGEWKAKTMAALEDKYLKKDDETGYLFNPDDPRNTALGNGAVEAATKNREQVLTVLSTGISAIAGEIDSADGIDEVRKAIEKIDIDTVIGKVNTEVNLFVSDCVRRYEREETGGRMFRLYSHSIERQLVKDAIGAEAAKVNFKEGLTDLLAKTGIGGETVELVKKAKSIIAAYMTEAFKNCRENELDALSVEKVFKTFAEHCLGTIQGDKDLWKNGLAPALKVAVGES